MYIIRGRKERHVSLLDMFLLHCGEAELIENKYSFGIAHARAEWGRMFTLALFRAVAGFHLLTLHHATVVTKLEPQEQRG